MCARPGPGRAHVSRTWTPVRHKGSVGTGGGGAQATIRGAERGGAAKRPAGECGVRVSVGCGRRGAVPTAQGHRRTGPCEVTGSQSSPTV